MWAAVLAAGAALAAFVLAWFCRAVVRLVRAWADYEHRVKASRYQQHHVGVPVGDLFADIERRRLAAARRQAVEGPTRELHVLR